MVDIYVELAEQLLKVVVSKGKKDSFIFYESVKKDGFGFLYKRGYSGLMAQPGRTGATKGKVRRKQGLFDVQILTGSRFEGKVSHRDLFEDLLENSSLGMCQKVWRGDDPRRFGRCRNEKAVLVTLALLMFEQEVNWGHEEWQKGSLFPPFVTDPFRRRPRDMLMGFIAQAFDLGEDRLDDLKYWMRIKPGTVTFGSPERGGPKFFRQYPKKKYFTGLEDDQKATALMVGEMRVKFREMASRKRDNPHFME